MDFSHYTVIAWLTIIALLSSTHHVKCQHENATLTISTHDVVVIVSERVRFSIELNGRFDKPVNVSFNVSHDNLVNIIPNDFTFIPESNITTIEGAIIGRSPGRVEIVASAIPPNVIDTKDVYVRVIVAWSSDLIDISSFIGWCYFVAWSISFYPQIYTNYKRKSVVGLNFDFLSLNILGFLLYTGFNIGLFAIPEIQDEYSRRFPRGLNPVQLNDVFFGAHATFATIITIIQCFIYDRADQRVSIVGRSIVSIFTVIVVISSICATFKFIHWLDFLYICSYIKLSITLIKYVPQAYMNYQRKSTNGWSIGNVLLDFTGGMLSMLQLILNAYNYDDWVSIFGDATKFGLGLFSVLFDLLFVLQHYVFYRNQEPYIEIDGDNNETTDANDAIEENDD